MPRPLNERQSLEQERAEIPGQTAAYRQELENGRPHKTRRERLEWRSGNGRNDWRRWRRGWRP